MTREYTSWGWRDKDNKVSSHYSMLIDHDTPVTGVIQANTVEWLSDEIFGGDSVDLGWEEYLAEFEAEHGREPTDEENDEASMGMEGSTHLIGDWRKLPKGAYEEVKDGPKGFSAIVGETYTQVVWSKTTTRAALCSPCFPGQADIGTPGEYLAYTLPADLMGNDS